MNAIHGKAICYVLIKPDGPRLRKVVCSLERVAVKSDESLLDKGWTLCNWHIVNVK